MKRMEAYDVRMEITNVSEKLLTYSQKETDSNNKASLKDAVWALYEARTALSNIVDKWIE